MSPTQPVAGILRPFAHAVVAAKIAGTVATADLAVGRTVIAGQVLVTLDAPEFVARRDQADSALAQAEREYEREQTTAAAGASTADAVRAADDHRHQARAVAQEAAAMLGYTHIAAPFAGVLTAEFVKPGDLALPGRALFELEGTDHFLAEVQVPESLAALALGCSLTVVSEGGPIAGTLVELSPAADPATRTQLAKIALPPADPAHSGEFVRVLWPVVRTPALVIPADAVSVLGQMERVFVVVTQHAQLRLVKTGAHEGDRVEITAGLDAGETVIVAPPATLREGQPVVSQQ